MVGKANEQSATLFSSLGAVNDQIGRFVSQTHEHRLDKGFKVFLHIYPLVGHKSFKTPHYTGQFDQ